jgi:hypothetical protein
MPVLSLFAHFQQAVFVYRQMFQGEGDAVFSVYISCERCRCAECVAEDLTIVEATSVAFSHWKALNLLDFNLSCAEHFPGYLIPQVHSQ